MKSWKIISDENILPINLDKKYKINALETLKHELAETKNLLDDEYKKKNFDRYWSSYDPFKVEKYVIANKGHTFNVSNAWIKCYEIINYYRLVDSIKDKTKFLHFDNAAFPGAFIAATHHLIATLFHKDFKKYHWKASSLYEINAQNKNPLEDKYGLYENYKDHWLMNKRNNGDVLIKENQLDFRKQLEGKVDLYTSDLGFDVSNDYNNQELIQAQANIGQILTGLLVLKKGGSFITKQYTTFEPTTVSVMYVCSYFFEEFYLCKPVTSREANGETYLVGKKFKGTIKLDHPYIQSMFDRISGKINIQIPIIAIPELPNKYLQLIVKSANVLTKSQIEKIKSVIELANRGLSRNKGFNKNDPDIQKFLKDIQPMIRQWYVDNPILPINNSDKLNMKKMLW